MFNNCAVLVIQSDIALADEYKLAGYVFPAAAMLAYHDGKMYDLIQAYDMGLLSDSDIENVYARHTKYREFEKEWKKYYVAMPCRNYLIIGNGEFSSLKRLELF